MALRSVVHSHPCRNFPPMMVTALDSLPILPDLAKDLNSHRDSAWAIRPRPADPSFFDQIVSVRHQDLGTERIAVCRAYPNSADPSGFRNFVPGFADSVVAGYSSPAVDLAFVDPGFVAARFVIVAAADPVAGLSFDLSCSAGFSATGAVVASDAASVSQSSS